MHQTTSASSIIAGVRGLDRCPRRSRPSSSSAPKFRLLDPDGGVPDPIGMGAEVYRQTAQRLGELIRARLEELTT